MRPITSLPIVEHISIVVTSRAHLSLCDIPTATAEKQIFTHADGHKP